MKKCGIGLGILFVGFVLVFSGVVFGNPVDENTFIKNYGIDYHEGLSSFQQTSDGGYIMVGTEAYWGWLVKVDSDGNHCTFDSAGECSGTGTFARSFDFVDSVTGRDFGFHNMYAVEQTSDGGYILGGQFHINHPDGPQGGWLIKTDANGNTCDWGADNNCGDSSAFSRRFDSFYSTGGYGWVEIRAITTNPDGGYTFLANLGRYLIDDDYDVWLVKTDSNGNTCNYSGDWECDGAGTFAKVFGGPSDETIKADFLERTSDGGYVFALDCFDDRGMSLNWMVKTDANGDTCNASIHGDWDQPTVGICADSGAGGARRFAKTVTPWGISTAQITNDGGYIAISSDYEIVDMIPVSRMKLIKLDEWGDEVESRMYGPVNGSFTIGGAYINRTEDGGYIIGGSVNGVGNTRDAIAMKVDANWDTCDYFNDDVSCEGPGTFVKRFGKLDPNSFVEAYQTDDGGFIFGSSTITASGDNDFWLVKTDENGNVDCNVYGCPNDVTSLCLSCESATGLCTQSESGFCGTCTAPVIDTFQTTFGGYRTETAQETSDGGFILSGYTSDGCTLIKTDSLGNEQWRKNHGGGSRGCYSAAQTSDGGYILVAFLDYATWLIIKTDSDGNTCNNGTSECSGSGTFVKIISGSHFSGAEDVIQASDGDYVITGTFNNNPRILKLSQDGSTIRWAHDELDEGQAHSIIEVSDGFVAAGLTEGPSDTDYLMVKVSSSGSKQWSRTFGGEHDDRAFFVREAPGGYIIGGQSQFHSIPWRRKDAWIVKTDMEGITCEYNRSGYGRLGECRNEGAGTFAKLYIYRDEGSSSLNSGIATDGGYILSGVASTSSITSYPWVFKTDEFGETCDFRSTESCDGDGTFVRGCSELGGGTFASVVETSDGGYVLGGGANDEILLVKIDEDGNCCRAGAPVCSVHSDCDDSNICTVDICEVPICSNKNADLSGDNNIGLADIMMIISAWGANVGDPGYTPQYDIDNNGNIGLSDIMLIIALWANNC